MDTRRTAVVLWAFCQAALPPLRGDEPARGFQEGVRVDRPTRLDWEFVSAGFGKDAVKLPADYDSRRQLFQRFVPKHYDAGKAWPLVVFVSPGDAPMGWRSWQKVCEDEGVLFCAPYAAGNNCPPGQRVRVVLDVFDQVRRDCRVDPERTYLAGFSGGGRVACSVAYALPEFFAGVVAVCGTNPLSGLDYLRHRARDRLSAALVTGEGDFNRAAHEEYVYPLLGDLGVRSRLWVVPRLGHAMPGPAVLAEAWKWLEDDLPRRRADVKGRPKLACPPDDELTAGSLAGRLLAAAEAELEQDARTWRGVAMLQGVVARWGRTEAAGKAQKRLEEIRDDDRRLRLVGDQGGREERAVLEAQARALERSGQTAAALEAWKRLAEGHPASAEGRRAAESVRRIGRAAAARPYLGIRFDGESVVVGEVAPDGPADRAGVRPGDRVRTLGATGVRSPAELRRALEGVKPGARLRLEVDREGRSVTLTVEVGSPPM